MPKTIAFGETLVWSLNLFKTEFKAKQLKQHQ